MRFQTVAVLSAICLPMMAMAQDVTVQKLSAYCETPPHRLGGPGENCRSTVQQIRAPRGYVFGEKTYKETKKSTNGGEPGECLVSWDEYREVVPGIMQPVLVKFQAYGEQNSGQGVGGHTLCEAEVKLIKLPSGS